MSSYAMAPSRSQQHSKMDLVTSSSSGGGQPQPQQQPQYSSHRFGGPDSRASYSERRLMQHSASVRTAHNHHSPSGWHHHQQQQAHHNPGRSSFNAGLAALSRSNGSLAEKDPNGNNGGIGNKPRSRTQTPGNSGGSGGVPAVSSPVSSNGSVGGRRPRRGDFGGSHGSLDALASGPERENFFALLRDLGAQSSSSGSGTGSANGNGSLVPSRSSPDRDLDDPVHAKPVGCAPSRLAELLKPNFASSANARGVDQPPAGTPGSFSLAQHQSVTARRSTPEPPMSGMGSSAASKSATLPPDATMAVPNNSSPKPRSKFQRFWDRDRSNKDHHSHKSSSNVASTTVAIATAIAVQPSSNSNSGGGGNSRSGSEPSIFKQIRGKKGGSKGVAANGINAGSPEPDQGTSSAERDASEMEARLDERLKRKAFSHYDCQSMSVNLGYAARLRGLLSQRRNTTTGASAASMAAASSNSNASNPSAMSQSNATSAPGSSNTGSLGKGSKSKSQLPCPPPDSSAAATDASPEGPEETDLGDGKSNHLLLDCPFFRNELGGEPEWCVGVSRSSSPQLQQPHPPPVLLHRPVSTYGVSVLEFPTGKTHWKHGICPYQRQPSVLERGDQGAFYYGNYFYGQDHQNWFGMDENLGPVAISIRREKIANDSESESSGSRSTSTTSGSSQQQQKDQYLYRIIVRTSELATLRGMVLEEAIPSLKPPGPKGLSLREVLDMVSPEIHLPCLRLAIPGSTTEQQLLKLDQQGLSSHYKVGILYCKAGQSTEEEMYNNEEGGPAFDEFLDLIGQRVRLRGFEKYKAGLDNKTDSTGLYSVYAQHQGCELMFHVSTLLPFTPNNRQQLLRKRHIGNDIVTVVFQEPGALPFTPRNIRSQFQHVFIIVRVLHPCTDHAQYQVAVSRSKEVPIFGPPIPAGASFPKSKSFAEFLLAKIINAEHAAHRSQKFATMATRTRQEYLKDLATNYVTSNTLDSGSKFPILTFSSRKKERLKPKFFPDAVQAGAICWQVSVDDYSGGGGSVRHTDALLGISSDSLVLIEEGTKECIWAVSSKSILGWTSSTSSIKLYYHQGECVTVQGRDCEADEIPEIVARLHAVTVGCGTRELTLRRNAVGQLGFHVQPDGLVTEVEPHGPAWQASLRQGFRLVEICKVTVSTLNHEQMVDLLKTSAVVTVTVLPPVDPNTPRRGCTLQSCSYIVGSIDGEYDNVHGNGEHMMGESGGPASTTTRSGAVQQQSASVHSRRLRYERSVSPPRSSSSSGYGTGSSSRSFAAPSALAATKERLPTNPEGTLTSTSSGHSSDDPWYDFMPDAAEAELGAIMTSASSTTSPPPLPSRQGPLPGTHHRMRPGHSCEIFTSPPAITVLPQSASIENIKSSSRNQEQSFSHLDISPVKKHPQQQQHGPPPPVNSNYSTPPSKPKPLLESPSLVGRMSNYEDLRRLQQQPSAPSPVLMGNSGPPPPSQQQETPGKVRPLNPPDYHHAMQSRLVALKTPDHLSHGSGVGGGQTLAAANRKSPSSYASRSEDELSASSGNSLSPRSRRRHHKNNSSAGTLTPSSGSSRNQSPRLLVEAKLKPNANGSLCSPSGNHHQSQQSQSQQKRCSSNLQEELLRLISPDADETSDAVIVTHARPVAVQSSPDVTAIMPDAEEMDWTRLVHAAARAIQGTASEAMMPISSTPHDLGGDEQEDPTRDGSDNQDSLTSWIDDVTEKMRLEAESADGQGKNRSTDELVQLRMSQLEQHVGSLESRLRSEEDRRQSLEAEIRRLRDANSRLQGESQTAAQQLKRFTDWFFQTIERP